MKYTQKLLILALSLVFFGQADAMRAAGRVVRRCHLLRSEGQAPSPSASKISNALKAKYMAGGAVLGVGADEAAKYYKDIATNKAKMDADIAKINLDAAIEIENAAKIKAQLDFEAEERAKAQVHYHKSLSDKIARIKASGINKINKDGFTPLSLAVKEGDLDLVNGLIANGAKVNMKYPWYKDYWFGPRLREPIIEAASVKGNIEVLKALIDSGARVNAREYYNGQKITPLIKAITNNDFEAVKLLVEKGANVGKGHFVRYEQKEHSYSPGKDPENPLRNLPPRTHVEYLAYRYNPADLAGLLGYYEIANFLRAKQIQKRL